LTCRPNFVGLSLGIEIEELVDCVPHALITGRGPSGFGKQHARPLSCRKARIGLLGWSYPKRPTIWSRSSVTIRPPLEASVVEPFQQRRIRLGVRAQQRRMIISSTITSRCTSCPCPLGRIPIVSVTASGGSTSDDEMRSWLMTRTELVGGGRRCHAVPSDHVPHMSVDHLPGRRESGSCFGEPADGWPKDEIF
jgi:hypothetical protein